jgi:hypothetical protein
MSESYQYFTLPISNVPETPPYNVWFATWSSSQSSFVWSTTRPAASSTPTYVCGATETCAPSGSIVIVQNGIKCIDPPPVAVPIDASESDFRSALQQGLNVVLDRTRSL